MDVYSVNGDLKHLLLVDGLDVINGAYQLERRKGGIFIPHTDLPVKKEMSIKPSRFDHDGPDGRWYKKGWIDYNTTLVRAEEILAKRKPDEQLDGDTGGA